jgi:hypothetical protein
MMATDAKAGVSAYEGVGLSHPKDPNMQSAAFRLVMGQIVDTFQMRTFTTLVLHYDGAVKNKVAFENKSKQLRFDLKLAVSEKQKPDNDKHWAEITILTEIQNDPKNKTTISVMKNFLMAECKLFGVDYPTSVGVVMKFIADGAPGTMPETISHFTSALGGSGVRIKDYPNYDIYQKPGGSFKKKFKRRR